MKLKEQRQQKVIFSLYMSLAMSFIMSLTITFINIGFHENILNTWFRAWSLAFWVAFPTTYFVSPVVQVLVNYTAKLLLRHTNRK